MKVFESFNITNTKKKKKKKNFKTNKILENS